MIPNFLFWIKATNLEYKLNQKINPITVSINTDNILSGKKFVLTGFRDKDLTDKLLKVGAIESNTITKETFILITSSKDNKSNKINQAMNLGVKIITLQDFLEEYNI